MDVRLMSAAPTDEERAAVDELLGPPAVSESREGERVEFLQGRVGRGGREVREQRTLLLPALHALQDRVGWISEGGMNYVCRRLTVPPPRRTASPTFYAMFSVEPRPTTVLHLCDDLACRVNGANELIDDVAGELGPDREDQIVRSPCLGLCERAPAALVQMAGEHGSGAGIGWVTLDVLGPFFHGGAWAAGGANAETVAPQTSSPTGREGLRLLRRAGAVDPHVLEDYRANDGYEALARAIDLGAGRVIQEITDAKLLGRGGAAFPTGVKWKAVADQPAHPHYLVCNADESEPGTFKDRVLMESDPFALVEAMTIAGFATGAEHGFIYIRGEYPLTRPPGSVTRSVPPATPGCSAAT